MKLTYFASHGTTPLRYKGIEFQFVAAYSLGGTPFGIYATDDPFEIATLKEMQASNLYAIFDRTEEEVMRRAKFQKETRIGTCTGKPQSVVLVDVVPTAAAKVPEPATTVITPPDPQDGRIIPGATVVTEPTPDMQATKVEAVKPPKVQSIEDVLKTAQVKPPEKAKR